MRDDPHGGSYLTSAYPPGPIEALDAFAEVLADAEAGTTRDAFYGRLCYAICDLASMDRAVIVRYDEALRRVRVAGTHNLDLSRFGAMELSVDSAPIAREALERDAVIEMHSPDPAQVPERYRSLIGRGLLVCVPLVAAGRWIGVALCDRASGAALDQREQHLLWTLGKTAALASAARIATFEGERARELQHRIDIAREVHERVVQRLFGVSLALDSDGDFPADARKRAAAEIQAALGELKSVVQQPLGRTARPTPTTLAEEVERLAGGESRTRIEAVAPLEVPPELEALAQSVLREALRNAQKHAEPTCVTVSAGLQGSVFVLEVVNDGVNGTTRQTTGMGLRLAAFEALQHGGFVEFGARDGERWQVRLVVPTGDD
jgi:signal transduction histidine kinase